MDYIFDKGKFTEEELEKAIIELFKEQGYTYVHGNDIEREYYKDVLIEKDIRSYLASRYNDLTETEIKTIINKIALISSSPLYNANKEAFKVINEGFDLPREDASKLAIHIDFINFNEPEKNIFKVVNQFTVEDVATRRPDLLIFVNGIPIAIFEFKTAIEEGTTIHDAWKQITIRYTRDIPRLMKYCFLSVISDGANTKMGSIFTKYAYYYAWNKVDDGETVSGGIPSLLAMLKGAFSKERLISILRDFIYYPNNSNKDEVIVTRYPQYFAANKMLENIKDHLKPTGDGKGGTYFGATGCGKTYTMLYLARLIIKRDRQTFNNPTIILITDRDDLDSQTSEIFENATEFLNESDVRSIESRKDLYETLRNKPSGGVYITTIQKFCEEIGLLSDRSNIICISDEAHRTQTNTGAKLKKTDDGVFTTYGFAKYLRDGFPNATYCGFTGTPIDETFAVFGGVVDSYTMKESCDDGITVRISYEPRLARVILSDEKAKEIERYYQKCEDEGSNPAQIEESKKAMTRINKILGDPDRLERLAVDMIEHYETLCNEKPEVVQKAMIVCSERSIAFDLLRQILKFRPEWGVAKKAEDESVLSEEKLEKLVALPKINLVATRSKDDEKEMFEALGNKAYKKLLEKQFKNNDSNFKIAIVVDMWITGFDVPSLAVMYIDKPLQRHTLIQTISRVNRVFEGKDKGIVVDYIGIRNNMLEAIKQYGNKQESPIDEINISLAAFRNHLKLLDDLMVNFNATRFYCGEPLDRLNCLNDAAEFVQTKKDMETRFMGLSRKMKAAYNICFPTGELADTEIARAQFYLAIRSIIYKQTQGDAPDAEIMNAVVEKMVEEAITCTGVENIVDADETVDLFSEEFQNQLKSVKLPISKFNALLKILKKAITEYSHTNKIKAIEFDERLKKVVERYNDRDNLVFTSEVVSDFIDDLSDEILKIFKDMEEDKASFEKMGITFEEKAFYDILIKVRDEHEFQYADEKCVTLAKEIKKLVDDKARFANWSSRYDIKSQLQRELIVLLYESGYPPEWNKEVFESVLEQAENFKKYN